MPPTETPTDVNRIRAEVDSIVLSLNIDDGLRSASTYLDSKKVLWDAFLRDLETDVEIAGRILGDHVGDADVGGTDVGGESATTGPPFGNPLRSLSVKVQLDSESTADDMRTSDSESASVASMQVSPENETTTDSTEIEERPATAATT